MPERTSAEWDNFASQNVVPEEWRNFMKDESRIDSLVEDLRPHMDLILPCIAHALSRALPYFLRFCFHV